jgi:hypothetical protein
MPRHVVDGSKREFLKTSVVGGAAAIAGLLPWQAQASEGRRQQDPLLKIDGLLREGKLADALAAIDAAGDGLEGTHAMRTEYALRLAANESQRHGGRNMNSDVFQNAAYAYSRAAEKASPKSRLTWASRIRALDAMSESGNLEKAGGVNGLLDAAQAALKAGLETQDTVRLTCMDSRNFALREKVGDMLLRAGNPRKGELDEKTTSSEPLLNQAAQMYHMAAKDATDAGLHPFAVICHMKALTALAYLAHKQEPGIGSFPHLQREKPSENYIKTLRLGKDWGDELTRSMKSAKLDNLDKVRAAIKRSSHFEESTKPKLDKAIMDFSDANILYLVQMP